MKNKYWEKNGLTITLTCAALFAGTAAAGVFY